VKLLRLHIGFVTSLWLISVVSLNTLIPLHFFVNEHKTISCNAEDKDCCSDQKSVDCKICAFDLYIGYPQEFNYKLQRFDILNFKSENFNTQNIIIQSKIYSSLRAPPVLI